MPKLVVDRLWRHTPTRTWLGIDRSVVQLDAELRGRWRQERPDWEYLSLIETLCNAEGCPVYFGSDRQRGISSFDYGHLTPLASRELARLGLVAALTRAAPAGSAGSGN